MTLRRPRLGGTAVINETKSNEVGGNSGQQYDVIKRIRIRREKSPKEDTRSPKFGTVLILLPTIIFSITLAFSGPDSWFFQIVH